MKEFRVSEEAHHAQPIGAEIVIIIISPSV
jgi:hypothetical protein